jgi:peptidoglycan/LPS O-acetylase OafA/YrhL
MPNAVNLLSIWGRFGVQLFFVISGFVVAYTLYQDRSMQRPKSIALYFMRRSVRLDPTYWSALLIYFSCVPLLLGGAAVDNWPERDYSGMEILKNVLYFLPIDKPFYMPVAWTLAIEVQFYVFFAVLILVINRAEGSLRANRDATFLWIASAIMVVALLNNVNILAIPEHWLFHHLHAFLGGILVALVCLGIRYAGALLALHCLTMILSFIAMKNSYVLASLIATLILLFATVFGFLQIVLGSKCLLRLGSLSYCIYLFHQLFGGLVMEFARTRISNQAGGHQIIFVIAGVVATVFFSELLYRLVEAPSIFLSKQISTRSAPKPPKKC